MKKNITTFSDLLLMCGQENKKTYELAQEQEAILADTSVEIIRERRGEERRGEERKLC